MGTTTITLDDHCLITMTPREVAEELVNHRIGDGDEIGEVRMNECGELEVDIVDKSTGKTYDTEYYTIVDIRENVVASDFYAWANDANGDLVLACFGNW